MNPGSVQKSPFILEFCLFPVKPVSAGYGIKSKSEQLKVERRSSREPFFLISGAEWIYNGDGGSLLDRDRPKTKMPILSVSHLSAGYENGDVVHDLSFSLERGNFCVILGRNGSGKSTILKALQRLIKNVRGDILVDGADVSRLSPRQVAQRIAYVPQIFDLPFEFSAGEVIAMGRYSRQGRLAGVGRRDSELIAEVMDLTETGHLRNKRIAHLSGGERQRVFIARALAQDAPLLFLDEPSAHLDISYQVEVYGILKMLQKQKEKTILCAEHNINLAVPYAGTVIFLKDGRSHSQGPPGELITRGNIREVFDTEVDIRDNPHSGKPEISLIPRGSDKG